MSHNSEQPKKVIAESEIGNNDVGHSKTPSASGVDVNTLTPEELKLALVISQQQQAAMQAELEKLKSASSSDNSAIQKLADLLTNAFIKTTPAGPTEADNINRSLEFKEHAARIDGASLMEAQSTMLAYRNEPKVPISVPKTFKDQFGQSLDVTVNGVRVSIPCDGKTYYINETHAIHARERIAKVDRLLADNSPQVIEIEA